MKIKKCISVFLIATYISVIGCSESNDPDITAFFINFKFVNHTNSTIRIPLAHVDKKDRNELVLLPNSTSDFYQYNDLFSSSTSADSCCQQTLEKMLGDSAKIILDDTLCVVHSSENSNLIYNYSYRVIQDFYFEYTYTFTSEDFEEAEKCD